MHNPQRDRETPFSFCPAQLKRGVRVTEAVPDSPSPPLGLPRPQRLVEQALLQGTESAWVKYECWFLFAFFLPFTEISTIPSGICCKGIFAFFCSPLFDSYQKLTGHAVWELLFSVSRLFTTALPCESLP